MSEKLHYLTSTLVPQYAEYRIDDQCKPEKCIRFNAFPPLCLCDIFAAVAEKAEKENLPIHFLHHPLDDSIHGIYLPTLQAALTQSDIFIPGETSFTDLYAASHAEKLKKTFFDAVTVFNSARTFHNLEEEIYIQHMDFSRADLLCNEFLSCLLAGRIKKENAGKAFHRFFGAASINGNLCYIPQLTETVEKRYFIKGRPGTGKSTFLKKIANTLLEYGIDTEIYHCSLDPNSLDMVIAREIGVCLFDSTAPHEFFPVRPSDEIIDLYKECVMPGTDEKYASRIAELETAYKEKIAEGLTLLNELYQTQDSFFGALPPVDTKAFQLLKQHALQTIFG